MAASSEVARAHRRGLARAVLLSRPPCTARDKDAGVRAQCSLSQLLRRKPLLVVDDLQHGRTPEHRVTAGTRLGMRLYATKSFPRPFTSLQPHRSPASRPPPSPYQAHCVESHQHDPNPETNWQPGLILHPL